VRRQHQGQADARPSTGQTGAAQGQLLQLVAEEPDLTLKQIGARLAADGIHVSKSCLHTFL